MEIKTLPNAAVKAFIQWSLEHQTICSEMALIFLKTPIKFC